jgi:hypothetical protein
MSLLAMAFLLQSCTVAYYQVQNGLEVHPELNPIPDCTVTFTLTVLAHPRQLTRTPSYKDEWLAKDYQKFEKATKKVFAKRGCKARKVDNEEEAGFRIKILKSPLLSALPQEWLTGLTFGAIPSWGTRPGELFFYFEDFALAKHHTYIVDSKSYNHIILFPVFWVTIIMKNESDIYKDALNNFIQGG